MSNVCKLSRHRLLNLATPFQIVQPSDAAGRCLSVSLELALAAQQKLGLAVSLVRWRIIDDPGFVDHWAVLLDDDSVIDLTRVQVDGVPRLVNPLSAYPANFTDRRSYPAALLTGIYLASLSKDTACLGRDFLWDCGKQLWRFDVQEAWRCRSWRIAAMAFRQGKTLLWFRVLSALAGYLERRAGKLRGRLDAMSVQAPPSAERRALPPSRSRPRAFE